MHFTAPTSGIYEVSTNSVLNNVETFMVARYWLGWYKFNSEMPAHYYRFRKNLVII